MRISKFLAALVATLVPLYSCSASVLVSVSAGVIRQSNGTPIPIDSIGVLVADTAGDGFGTSVSLVGSTLSVNSSLGGSDNLILKTFFAQDIGGGIIGFSDNVNYSYSGALAPNVPLAIMWFPSISATGVTIGTGISYGFYRTDVVDTNSGSEIAFFGPADGVTVALNVYDNVVATGAVATPANLTASKVTAVPEPSSVIFLTAGGALLAGAMVRRRKVA